MRPIRLELKGFTSFRDPQVVDFDGLDLFAISGPTGSGKSSILDAMTYALFGMVDRVGRQVGQLVSQGQPRMAVTFEFAVSDERWRVTRSTPSSGSSRVLLERRDSDEDEWRQAGEGADKVRDAEAMIRAAIGLDFETFSRAVILPQGKFAEFLVGDAKQRRNILTDLLGLELFERLAKRSGDMKRLARDRADAKAELFATEYAGVTEEAIEVARQRGKDAEAIDVRLAQAETGVAAVFARHEAGERQAQELAAVLADVRALSVAAEAAAQGLAGAQEATAAAEEGLASAATATTEAQTQADAAAVSLAEAERESGSASDLAGLRAKAEQVLERQQVLVRAIEHLAHERAGLPDLERGCSEGAEQLALATATNATAAEVLQKAREGVEASQQADLAASVREHLHVGAPCPVCGTEVATLPKASKAGSGLAAARKAVTAAEKQMATAEKAVREAERAKELADRTLAETGTRWTKADEQIAAEQEAIAEQAHALSAVLGDDVDSGDRDLVAAIDARRAAVEALAVAVQSSAARAESAERARVEAERAAERIVAEIARHASSLAALSVASVAQRVATLLDTGTPTSPLAPITAPPEALGDLLAQAAALVVAASEAIGALEAIQQSREDGEAPLFREAQAAVADALGATEVPELLAAGSLVDLKDAVASARRRIVAAAATAEHEVAQLTERLAHGRALDQEVRELSARAARFDALSKELRADRIIAFLQQEALALLAIAASHHLGHLSSERYRLEYLEDEFYVVDTWNGDEARRARTLSGGETFLASLALALALSEEVRALAVTEKATLDSLFLDEGFGTLDPETLETVVEAIEQLGGDGRMVGVITHVSELAVRLPARIEVEKSPRGSSLRILR